MIPETAKLKVEELSREELIALIDEMAKKSNELEAEIARSKQTLTTSQNSSQPPSRDFKGSTSRKRKRSKRKGAQPGHEKQERPLVDNPNKIIEALWTTAKIVSSIYWIKFQCKLCVVRLQNCPRSSLWC